MSAGISGEFDIEEQRKRIYRMIAESEKFAAEQRKLNAEAEKFVAEQRKLASESAKLDRDRGLAPWLAGGAIAGGVITIANLVLHGLGLTH